MQTSVKKLELLILGFSFTALFWLLLGIKLKAEDKIYNDIILPLKGLLEANPNANIDIARIESIRFQLIDSVNIAFFIILAVWIYFIYAGSFTKVQKVYSYCGVFFLSSLFIILPRIS